MESKSHISKMAIIGMLEMLLFAVLCFGSLFLKSSLFVDSRTVPKWYLSIFCCLALLLVVATGYLLSKNDRRPIIWSDKLRPAFFIILISCSLQALYGIFQFLGLLPAHDAFRVTGSFENPAGFSACLCAGFPFCVYFFKDKNLKLKYTAIVSGFIIILAVILSASRTGIICLSIVCSITIFSRIRAKYKKTMLVLLLVLIPLLFALLYFLKKDSADGRRLVWYCSLNMIKDKPVFGYGSDGFRANYMLYQADFLAKNPNSRLALFADSTSRPFSEYLSILINYGIVGFSLLLILVFLVWKAWLRNPNNESKTAGLCLLSLCLLSFFSYPFSYPLVWILCFFSILLIIHNADYKLKATRRAIKIIALFAFPFVLVLCLFLSKRMMAEIRWCKIAKESLSGWTIKVLPQYALLKNDLGHKPLFLYNYAAELHEVNHYEESLNIALACEKIFADYELQLLLADDYLQLKQYKKAETHYLLASQMCPIRFLPLYKLVNVYESSGAKAKALNTARIIINKPVKVASPEIDQIKIEMKNKIKYYSRDTPLAAQLNR